MKTFSQLFLELLEAVATKRKPFDSVAFDARQKAKYGSSMAKAAADALAAAQKKKAAAPPSRKTLPWVTSPKMFPAWWHPTKEAMLFNINNDGYHITKLVKYPEKFGIYGSDLTIAAEQDADDYSSNWSGRKVGAKELLDDIRKGDIDNSPSIMELAYRNGWLRVYGGKFHTGEVGGTLEGMDKKSMKAAIKEIEQAAEMAGIENIRIDVTDRSSGYPKFTKLDTKAKRDAYMKG